MELPSRIIQHMIESARAIMHADCASLQRYSSERNALKLLTHYGLDDCCETFEWIFPDSHTTCAAVLRTGHRVIVPDLEACESIPLWHEAFRRCDVRSVQSTPLLGPDGNFVGMCSTYWRVPYEPNDQELRLFDAWARQTADTFDHNRELTRLLQEVNRRIGESNQQVDRCNRLVERLRELVQRQPRGYIH